MLVTVPHWPDPLHLAAGVYMPLLQVSPPPQVVLTPAYEHDVRLVPSHTPPQVPPAPAHGVRLPTGAPLLLTGVQMPLPLQYSHWPVQALPQQTPSTQLPPPHSPARVQEMPIPLRGTHLPDAQ